MNISTPIFCWLLLTGLILAVSAGCLITRMPQRELQEAGRVLLLLYLTGTFACWAWEALPAAWATLVTLALAVYAEWQHRRPS